MPTISEVPFCSNQFLIASTCSSSVVSLATVYSLL
jgi:hypothetical protein